MTYESRRRCQTLLAIGVLLTPVGCGDFEWPFGKRTPPEKPPRRAVADDPLLTETVGAHALLTEASPLQLRGFGVVAGLGDNGGSDCPTSIREYLIDFFSRELLSAGGDTARRSKVSPRALIDSPDTAVVEITGLVPAGAPSGAVFDVRVEAIDSQTRSLEGGVLLPCELKVFDVSASGRGLVAGRPLARARGALFTNPFATAAGASSFGPRRGLVLGGAHSIDDRNVRLLLDEPSYSMAQRIESRINERFGQHPKTAEAMSRGYVKLLTPARYEDDPALFVELVSHLQLENSPNFIERRLNSLDEIVRQGAADRLHTISLLWEGVGRQALPHVQNYYADSDISVQYYAARAGLRNSDVNAVPVMGRIAQTPGTPLRLPALRELQYCGLSQATRYLAPVVDDADADVRIAAYEALRSFHHPIVRSRHFRAAVDPTQTNFTLDVVDSAGPPLIYVQRTRDPRIAVFGRSMPVRLPMFYTHPDDWVTLNALEPVGDITVMCRTRRSGRFSETLHVPARVIDLIRGLAELPLADKSGVIQGLGLPFTLVVQVCQALQDDGTISAQLVVEDLDLSKLFGPSDQPQRPEADEIESIEEAPPERQGDDSDGDSRATGME